MNRHTSSFGDLFCLSHRLKIKDEKYHKKNTGNTFEYIGYNLYETYLEHVAFPSHLATSWNCARVMLGPLNLFTISLILKSEISYLEPLHNISDLGGQ